MSIAKAKEILDLRDIVKLEKQSVSGEYVTGLCPFHDDTNPSLMVFRDGWKCLSSNCSRPRGSVLDWISHQKGIQNPTGKDIYDIAQEVVRKGSYRIKSKIIKPEKKKPKMREKLSKPLTIEVIKRYCRLNRIKVYSYMRDYRGFTTNVKQAMDFFGFGHDGNNSIVIPVWEGVPWKSDLISIRFRNLDNESSLRYYGLRGYNKPALYNFFVLELSRKIKVPVFVFYGEFDSALALWELGIPAVSPTNGCKSLNTEWFEGVDKIYITPDVGEEMVAYKHAEKLGLRAEVIPLAFPNYGKDFTDQMINHREGQEDYYDKYCPSYKRELVCIEIRKHNGKI